MKKAYGNYEIPSKEMLYLTGVPEEEMERGLKAYLKK